MDALLSKRDDGSGSGSSDALRGRILTQLLTLMDGFGSSSSSTNTTNDSAGQHTLSCHMSSYKMAAAVTAIVSC
jgi:SpoVK/Ycf46/Vps4 family AAA+-type ATPase